MFYYPFYYPYGRSYPRYYSNYSNRFSSSVKPQMSYNAKVDSNISSEPEDEKKENRISDSSDDMDYFEIFGLRLYFDDILIICLLFFLYNEGVQDQELFISLILLLLS